MGQMPRDDAGAVRPDRVVIRSSDADADPIPSGDQVPRRPLGRTLLDAVREMVVIVVMALALSFVVKSWLIQAFYIPSESMEDTLVKNDRVVVNKLTPKFMDLHRGDVVVFSDPGGWADKIEPRDRGPLLNGLRTSLTFVGLLPDPADDHLIKRLIGLPGDRVVCCDAQQRLTVNGAPLSEPYLKAGVVPSLEKFDITVPANRIWVMGDNRSNSADSRFHDNGTGGRDGSVSIDLVTGRAFALVWPVSHLTWLSDYPEVFAKVPAAPTSGAAAGTTTP